MTSELAIHGGQPVRRQILPYGRQAVSDEDVAAVVETLRSDWLTTGPRVGEFEKHFSQFVGAREAVAVSSGSAALHSAMHSLGIGPGDEVLVPAMTFAASANCVLHQGARPVFVDVDPATLLMAPESVDARLTPKTRAILAVDFGGQPCDYDQIGEIARRQKLTLVVDAAHSLGAEYRDKAVGTLGTLNTFSLHPVKAMTTGEGGMVTTDDPDLARRMRSFRNHGFARDHTQREKAGSWSSEMRELGYNYRLTDIQCALGISQLGRVPGWIRRRQEIAGQYDAGLAGLDSLLRPLAVREDVSHSYHLYVIRLKLSEWKVDRAEVFSALRGEGIGVNVHYIPVHLHPYYREHLGTRTGMCPNAEAAYEEILSLPIFPGMSQEDVENVMEAVTKVARAYAR